MAEMGLPVGFETTKVLYLCNNRGVKELIFVYPPLFRANKWTGTIKDV